MSTEPTLAASPIVLYVDDEEQALKYFRKGLDKDFRILTAPSVAQAMEYLEKDAASIGVVITDQRMPGKSGVALLTELRQRWPAIVRILITAYTDIDSAVAAVNAGAVYKYITKPADFQMLRQILTEALSVYRDTMHREVMAKTLHELQEQRKATEQSEAAREQLQQRLIAASREAGRAEVATGILHNVGNVLNSMNVSASVVSNTLQQSRVGNLCKGLSMLEEHTADLANFITADERGIRLPGYLIKLAPVLKDEQAVIGDAITSLNRSIEHIMHVVRMQQSNAKEIILSEPVDPSSIIEEAIRVNQSAIDENGVRVVREYGQSTTVLLDQHRVLQILINLISNGVTALSGVRAEDRELILRIVTQGSDPSPTICLQVMDKGQGIAPENLTRIFGYGFTTKAEGHGFGLHSAANAAREMGGSLTATSGGPGMGATFTLQLPMRRERDNVASDIQPPAKAAL